MKPHQHSSDQIKILKDQSPETTARVAVATNAQLHIACGYLSYIYIYIMELDYLDYYHQKVSLCVASRAGTSKQVSSSNIFEYKLL